MTPIKWFFGFLKKHTGKMILGLLLTTIITILAIINPQMSGLIIDEVITNGNYSILPKLIIIIISVNVFRSILRYCYQLIFETCSQGVIYEMRDKVYRKLLQEDFQFYNKNRTGDLMSRQIGDMDAIRHFVSYVIYAIFENFLLFMFALLMIFTVNVKLALCMVMILPFMALTTYCQSKAIKPVFHKTRERFSSLNTFVQENISGNRVVRAFAKEDFELSKFTKENEGFKEAELNAANVWMKYVPIFEFLSNVLTIILMLYGGYMVIEGELTLGGLVTVNGYLWMLNVPLRYCGWWINDVGRFITCVEKIYGTYSQEPTIKTPGIPYKQLKMNGNITFSNVSYCCDDETIVSDINFSVKQGQTIGIIGSTGSGKSTIMNLLCRFYDTTSGEILIDGTNIKDYNLYDLRDNIGMAMQDVFLFSDTIEGNIAYAKPNCPFEDVKKAAKMADANLFIQDMPEGYDTIIGERGVGLSGGQKQRISLARALLKDPSILILDDTTSAVDMETESYIQNQLKSLEKKCTVFIIAYRISSIIDADLILVMNNGKIIEQGTHHELLERKGYYFNAFQNQYGNILDTEGGV